tara:strand:- start:233 stop:553 length:321 start_codon:yes stop_codon:yes gene_type:complete
MNSKKINQLQLLQQNQQNIIVQKQQMDEQLTELNSALTELKSTSQAYKIAGKIMIATSKDKLTKELGEKKEFTEVRLQNFTKQEEKLKHEIEKVQKEVMTALKKEE